MGFKLEIEKYCEKCPAFKPEISSGGPIYSNNRIEVVSDTIIRCENNDICRIIENYLIDKLKPSDPFSFK